MQKMSNADYAKYIETISPKSKIGMNLIRAFFVGGAISGFGEGLFLLFCHFGAEVETARGIVIVALIFLGAGLTCLGVYDKLTNFGKAGALVPITGFANAVVSPAMEYKAEGHIAGIGAKMFSVAGPVLVYGALAAMLYGLVLALIGS